MRSEQKHCDTRSTGGCRSQAQGTVRWEVLCSSFVAQDLLEIRFESTST